MTIYFKMFATNIFEVVVTCSSFLRAGVPIGFLFHFMFFVSYVKVRWYLSVTYVLPG